MAAEYDNENELFDWDAFACSRCGVRCSGKEEAADFVRLAGSHDMWFYGDVPGDGLKTPRIGKSTIYWYNGENLDTISRSTCVAVKRAIDSDFKIFDFASTSFPKHADTVE